MKNKKGFTLAEILGVIVIIGLLLIIAGPLIINRIRNNKEETETLGNKIIYSAAEQYINENNYKYPKGKSYCIKISDLVQKGKLTSPVVNITTGENLENKSVLVKRMLSGYTSYNIYDDSTCDSLSKIDPIEISIDPSRCTNITNVTIIYPQQIGQDYKHTKDDGSTVNDHINTSNREVVEQYYKNNTITAEFKYNNIVIKEKRIINNIDNKKPEIVEVTPNGNTNWETKTTVNIKVKDEGCGLKNNQSISYGWTDNKNTIPTNLYTTNLINYSNDNKNANIVIPESSTNNLTGTYYLYISPGIEDIAGNRSEKYTSNSFKFDNTGPTCKEWKGINTTWTNTNRTISVTCQDNESGCINDSYDIKTYSSGTTKTENLTKIISDKLGNTTKCEKNVNVYYDKDKPECGTWTENKTWTKNNVTIKVECKKGSGSDCESASYNVKTYSSGTVKTNPEKISVTIKDKAGNTATCSKDKAKANVYIDKEAPTISYSKLSGTYYTEALPYKGYTFYYKDNDGGSGIQKNSSGEYFQAYTITNSGCNSGWKDAGGDLCTAAQNNNASAYWRAYRVKDAAGNSSKVVCSYLNNNGTFYKSGPSDTCTVNGKSFSK